MTKFQQLVWKWNSPANEGYRLLTGLVFWASILIASVDLAWHMAATLWF